MICKRCAGLMVIEDCIDLKDSSMLWIQAFRCITCGNIVDSVIDYNKRYWVTTDLSSKPRRRAPRTPNAYR